MLGLLKKTITGGFCEVGFDPQAVVPHVLAICYDMLRSATHRDSAPFGALAPGVLLLHHLSRKAGRLCFCEMCFPCALAWACLSLVCFSFVASCLRWFCFKNKPPQS